jgi:hypothetical protein
MLDKPSFKGDISRTVTSRKNSKHNTFKITIQVTRRRSPQEVDRLSYGAEQIKNVTACMSMDEIVSHPSDFKGFVNGQ